MCEETLPQAISARNNFIERTEQVTVKKKTFEEEIKDFEKDMVNFDSQFEVGALLESIKQERQYC